MVIDFDVLTFYSTYTLHAQRRPAQYSTTHAL